MMSRLTFNMFENALNRNSSMVSELVFTTRNITTRYSWLEASHNFDMVELRRSASGSEEGKQMTTGIQNSCLHTPHCLLPVTCLSSQFSTQYKALQTNILGAILHIPYYLDRSACLLNATRVHVDYD